MSVTVGPVTFAWKIDEENVIVEWKIDRRAVTDDDFDHLLTEAQRLSPGGEARSILMVVAGALGEALRRREGGS